MLKHFLKESDVDESTDFDEDGEEEEPSPPPKRKRKKAEKTQAAKKNKTARKKNKTVKGNEQESQAPQTSCKSGKSGRSDGVLNAKVKSNLKNPNNC